MRVDMSATVSDPEVARKVPVENMPQEALNDRITSPKREGSPLASDRPPPAILHRLKERVPPHDPDSEPREINAISLPPARKAERIATQQAQLILDYLNNTSYPDEEVDRLKVLVERCLRVDYENTIIETVVKGDTGKGKTATVNSVTSYKLGNVSRGFHSVTNVVLVFRGCHAGQNNPFKVQVFLYPKVYVMKVLTERLGNFRQSTSASDDDNDQFDAHEESDDAKLGMIQVITDLFAFRDECTDSDAAEEFLLETGDEKVLKLFASWLDIIYEEILGGDPSQTRITMDCPTADAVNKVVAPFVSTTPEPFIKGTNLKCCPYPLVDTVEVAFKRRMLSTGNIIKDVPGFGDTNTAHVERAHMALKGADKIMLVFEMKRIVDNRKLYSSIEDAYKTRGAQGVFLVITHCAVLPDNDDKSVIFTPTEDEIRKDIAQQKDQLESEIAVLEQQESQVNELAAKRELDAEIRNKKIQHHAFEVEDCNMRVRARNRAAKNGIRAKLKSRKVWKAPQELTIVCVDNEQYDIHAAGYAPWTPENPNEAPSLPLETTGILELRSLITEFPANGRWEALKHHINEVWPSTLNALQMSASVTKARRKAQVDAEIANTLETLVAVTEELFENFESGPMTTAKAHMASKQKEWMQWGEQYCQKLANTKEVHFKTHLKIMQNSGCSSSKKGEFNSNKTLLVAPLKDIDKILIAMREEHVPKLFASLATRIQSVVDKLTSLFENDLRYELVGVDMYVLGSIRTRRSRLKAACSHAQKNIVKAVTYTHDCASDAHGEHSYFAASMQNVYNRSLKAQKKKSSSLRTVRHKAFETAFKARNGPYHQLQAKIMEELSAEIAAQRRDLNTIIQDIFAEIKEDIESACSKKQDDSAEGRKFRKDIQRIASEVQEQILGECQPCLVEAEQMAKAQRRALKE